jgi:glycine C-acetyltransferase
VDIFEKVVKNMGPIGAHAHYSHHYFSFPKLTGELGPRMTFMGKEMLNWSLNNYLGLANHPEVRKADADAAAKYGLAYPMGARMMSGNTNEHEAFEKQLAEFVGKEDSFLLNYGYQGVMSLVECMVDHRDIIVYDAESHACLIDGIRLHKAKMGAYYKFNHNDMDSLRKNLERAKKRTEETGGGILVITEGVFGMSGKVGALDKIVEMKKDFDFRLLVDDAHGFGTLGKTGAGAGEEQGVQDEIDLYFSTFAKSMASIGAFVAGPKQIIDYVRYNIRSQIFAKSLPMPLVIGNLKRLEMLKTQPSLKAKLWENALKLQNGLKEKGFDIGKTDSVVTPVYMKGGVEEATYMVTDLRENYNIFCSIVVYPVIPKGHIIYRLIPTAVHTDEEIQLTLTAFEETKKKLDEGLYKSEAIAQMAEI